MLLFKLSPYYPAPLDHFVHMVLFFHCADDDYYFDDPVLHRKWGRDWMLCENLPSSGAQVPLSPISGTNKLHYPFLWTRCHNRSILRRQVDALERHDKHFDTTASTQTACSVAKDKTRDATALRSCTKTSLNKKAGGRSQNLSLVVLYVLSGDTKDNYTHSQAGLLPLP